MVAYFGTIFDITKECFDRKAFNLNVIFWQYRYHTGIPRIVVRVRKIKIIRILLLDN